MTRKAGSNQLIAKLILGCIITFSDLSSPGSAYIIKNLSSSEVRSCHHPLASFSQFSDSSIRTRCHQSPKKAFRSQRHSLQLSRDPNESVRNPLISHPILRTISAPPRKIWGRCRAVLQFKWTIFLLLIVLGRQSFSQASQKTLPKAALLGFLGTILVDQRNKITHHVKEDDKGWTPLAQSKLRLFWQAPVVKSGQRGGSSKNSIHKRESFNQFTSSKIRQNWGNFYFGCKKMLRYMVEGTTVYVLECENQKYYVGSTVNLKRRMNQHFHNSRGGSVWTKKHKPIQVRKIYRRVPYRYKLGFESQVTAELMWEKGINSVRGAMYLYTRDYTRKDIDSLVSFLGHYNDLSYHYVRKQLFKELPQEKAYNNSRSRRKDKRKHLQKAYEKKWTHSKEAVEDLRNVTSEDYDDSSDDSSDDNDDDNDDDGIELENPNSAGADLTITNAIASGDANTKNDDDTDIDPYRDMDAWLNRNIEG